MMKNFSKLLAFVCAFTMIITIFSFNTDISYASELNNNDELNEGVYDGLAEGEEVVDVYTEYVPVEEAKNVEVTQPFQFETDETTGGIVTPQERVKRWYAVSSTYVGHSYSSWYYAGASTISSGVLTASHSSSVSNKYSGSLKVSKKTIEGMLGFDTTKTWTETVGYSSPSYPNGRYRLEYRHVYKKYKVKQIQSYDRRGKVYATKYVYPQKWVERMYRVVKF
ncbi:hypothetical protein LC087_04395 [Bacillus carboniphilus]|uniref:Uncharacterized protein n=1 Tax=Bacillus carboniphilus TaxID=86663 RepID=A0ABY9JVI6_9BACI|nr:hypothetical protein [Bacillus carboniphilus]WLR43421.1 hypothetical protein LC087_04395 [Bacillus carboniphilus]